MKNNLPIRELTDKMMSLYTEGKYSDALEPVEENADKFPDFETSFDQAIEFVLEP